MEEIEEIVQNIPLNQRYDTEKFLGKDVDQECYERMPVVDFGLTMLQQMGWSEQRGIGLNPINQLKKPIEFVPRHHRLGLGADPVPLMSQNKINSNNKNDQKNQNLVSKSGKNYNYIGEALVEKKKFQFEINDRVKIVEGKHSQLQGCIQQIYEENETCQVELDNGEKLKVQINYLQHIDNINNQDLKSEKNKKQMTIYEGKSKVIKSRSRSRSQSKENKKIDKNNQKKIKWVQPHIRVRIVSKVVNQGKYYNTKVIVNDIIDKYNFSLITQNGEYIENLCEDDLETVIPDIGQKILILFGKFKGKEAILKERNKKKNKVIVYISDEQQIYECTQDDISEYVE